MALNPEPFHLIETLPQGTQIAIVVVLLAGLSQAAGQGIVLFVNRVTPLRFGLSLVVAALLFAVSTVFWVLSVWGASHVLYGVDTAFMTVFRVMGLAYAPLLWSFLTAVPYLGVPISVVLSIWSLLSFVRGFDLVTDLDRWQVVWCALLGWVVFQIMQRTIGRPAEALGQWIADSVAGTTLVTNIQGLPPSGSRDLALSPCNGGGWYIYGAKNQGGQFVVQALAPCQLFSLLPDRELVGKKPATEYLKKGSWALAGVKGTISSVLLRPRAPMPDFRTDLQVGNRLLLNHLYGGVGGKMREPAAQGPVYFGHFAYGLAEVVLEPLTDELRLEIQYFQVYAHNSDGLIACRQHWSNYMGDRQYGWLGLRPVRDIVIKLDAFTGTYDLDGELRSPLDGLIDQLQIMMARYRIGDGTGSTFVGPANNCAQDSNQALYAALQRGSRAREWTQVNPDAAPQIKQLMRLGDH